MARLAKDGHWPAGGGIGDQAAGFLRAARYVWAEIDRCHADAAAELRRRPRK